MTRDTMSEPSDRAEFSLITGGPLYQFFLRTGLARPEIGLLHRRILALSALAWLPVAVLALADGRFFPGKDSLPFLYDVEGHVRLLVVLPLLLASELPVHQRLGGVLRQFIERKFVRPEDRARFDAAVASAMRLRNSMLLELALVVLVYTFGHWLWRSQIAIDGATWYAKSAGSSFDLTLPGYWYSFVSIPLFQFVFGRWYLRVLIWIRLLWQISRMPLQLSATHPDRSAGLGFVGNSVYAFAPLFLAHGALLSGWIADRVLNSGHGALDFQVEAAVVIACIVIISLAPFCVFMPILSAAKRRGRREYGLLAAQYTQAFEGKWIHGEQPRDEPLLGSADIQSLADLGNSYTVVQETRLVPFGIKHATLVAMFTAAPLVPLAFTVLPFRALVTQSLKILF